MRAILYIGHGSRSRQAAEQAVHFMKLAIGRIEAPIRQFGFLELAEPELAAGFARCIGAGAAQIIAAPVFLLAARHVKRDIPAELSRLAGALPKPVDVRIARPFGVHDALIDIAVERIRQAGGLAGHSPYGVLLVGRGSSDEAAVADLREIAGRIRRKLNIRCVSICFLAAAAPNLAAGLAQMEQTECGQVYVVPWLLFAGTLMERVESAVDGFNQRYRRQFVLCGNLGYDPAMIDILRDRIQEAAADTPAAERKI